MTGIRLFCRCIVKTQHSSGPLRARTSVLTIHNIGYQGIMPSAAAADLGLERPSRCSTPTTSRTASSTH